MFSINYVYKLIKIIKYNLKIMSGEPLKGNRTAFTVFFPALLLHILLLIKMKKILEEIEKQNRNKISKEKKQSKKKKETITNPKEMFIYKNQKIISENT